MAISLYINLFYSFNHPMILVLKNDWLATKAQLSWGFRGGLMPSHAIQDARRKKLAVGCRGVSPGEFYGVWMFIVFIVAICEFYG